MLSRKYGIVENENSRRLTHRKHSPHVMTLLTPDGGLTRRRAVGSGRFCLRLLPAFAENDLETLGNCRLPGTGLARLPPRGRSSDYRVPVLTRSPGKFEFLHKRAVVYRGGVLRL